MKFLDEIKKKLLPGYDLKERIRVSEDGERLERIVGDGSFDVLRELIFDPMVKESFEAFKRLDPANVTEIMQAQKMAQVIAEIERRVERKIKAGISAREQIKEDSTQQEGE